MTGISPLLFGGYLLILPLGKILPFEKPEFSVKFVDVFWDLSSHTEVILFGYSGIGTKYAYLDVPSVSVCLQYAWPVGHSREKGKEGSQTKLVLFLNSYMLGNIPHV